MGRKKISDSVKMESFLLPVKDKDLLLQASRLFGVSKSRLIRLSCRYASCFILSSYQKANDEIALEVRKFFPESLKLDRFKEIQERHRLKAEKLIKCFLDRF